MKCAIRFLINIHKLGVSSVQRSIGMNGQLEPCTTDVRFAIKVFTLWI